MKIYQRLSTKFLSFGVGLLILALLSIGLTMWITRQLDGGAAAVNEAGRLRMQAWRLSSAMAGGRDAGEVAQLVQQSASVERKQSVAKMAVGSVSEQAPPVDAPEPIVSPTDPSVMQERWLVLVLGQLPESCSLEHFARIGRAF